MFFSHWLRTWKDGLERQWTLQQRMRHQPVSRRKVLRLHLETLEDRQLLSTYVVTSTADDGTAGTLRAAINAVNSGLDNEINFNIPGSGVQTINLTSALPTITANGVSINGLSQGGNGNTTRLIELNGTNAGSSSDGLWLQGSGCTLSGLLIENFGNNGVEIQGSNNTIGGTSPGAGNVISGNTNDGILIDSVVSGVQVQGNFIGTDATGTAALGNGNNGIEVREANNTIGGTANAARNILSGNGNDGVLISASAVAVQGNYIGTDVTGSNAITNANEGVAVNASNNTIGGTVAGARNVISGNYGDSTTKGMLAGGGVLIDTGVAGVQVQGNFIGTNAAGTSALGDQYGIWVLGYNDTIGGTTSAARNIISGDSGAGIFFYQANGSTVSGDVVQGNYIGTDYRGTSAIANWDGIDVFGSNNTIGGSVVAAHNLISGNANDGVFVGGAAEQVQGNYIGTNAAGTSALANNYGIALQGNGDTIGGSASSAGNVISGNTSAGIYSDDTAGTIEGNYIGTNAAGTGALGNGVGVELLGSGNTVGSTIWAARNIISGNSSDGVRIDSNASGNQVFGNVIGYNVNGSAALANSNGIEVQSSGNTIGGTAVGQRNFIAGNSNDGVLFTSGGSGNVVLGNFLGLISSGLVLSNSNGVEDASGGNTIGGTISGARNFISGNSKIGVLIDSTASGTLIEGDSIGLNTASNGAAANNIGIAVYGSINTIGGTTSAARNIISGNTGDGVLLGAASVTVQGNYIGTDISGKSAVGNGNGVEIAALGATLGGMTSPAANFLSGNTKDGVIIDSSVSAAQVLGNYIGLSSIDGSLGNSGNGVEIAGTGNLIGDTVPGAGNVISGNGGAGVFIDPGASGNVVQGNALGLNAPGNAALANKNGIEVQGTANTLGGLMTEARNFIAGNSNDGLLFDSGASGNAVQGNFIGLDSAGTLVINGANGVEDAGGGNTIGGTRYGARNIISGNKNDGVLIDSGVSGTLVQGNYIGTNPAGTGVASITTPANNNGIEIAGSSNTVGGTVSAARNIISANTADGVMIDSSARSNQVQGNFIGLNVSSSALANGSYGVSIAGNNNSAGGTVVGAGNTIADNAIGSVFVSGGSGNTIRRNAVYANGSAKQGPGIVVSSGANNNLTAPALSSATFSSATGKLKVSGSFAGNAGVTYELELFANPASDAEGKFFLGTKIVTPTKTGTVLFSYNTTLPASFLAAYPLITATLNDATGDTSAFSNGVTAS